MSPNVTLNANNQFTSFVIFNTDNYLITALHTIHSLTHIYTSACSYRFKWLTTL